MSSSAAPRLRLAIAGGGLIAQTVHLPTLADLDDRFEVVGLADPVESIRQAVTRKHEIPLAVADHRELLEHELDGLLVCAPNERHAEIVLDALDAGCHVLVEKPLCVHDDEAKRIVRRRDELGLVVQVGYMKRYDSAWEALRHDLAVNRPQVRHVSTLTIDPGLTPQFAPPGFVAPPSPRAAVFSSAFLGALVHDVNAVRGLLGDPETEALEVLDGFAAPAGDLVGGTVALKDGTRWTMAWALEPHAGRFEQQLRLLADDGLRTLTFPAPYLRRASAVLRVERASDARGSVATEVRSHADAYTEQWLHFHACVTGGEPCRTPPEQARADNALLTRLHDVAIASGAAA